MNRRTVIATAAVLSTPLVTGCTDYGGGGGTPTGTATSQGDRQRAREKYPDYSWSRLEGKEPVATSTIEMRNTEFHPSIAAFQPDTTVTFENEDSTRHTVTVPKLGIDTEVAGGESTSETIGQAGRFDYVCTRHPPDMLGRLEVTENSPRASPTPGGTATESPTPTEGTGDGY